MAQFGGCPACTARFCVGVEATPVRDWHNHPPCLPSPALQKTQCGASVDKLRDSNPRKVMDIIVRETLRVFETLRVLWHNPVAELVEATGLLGRILYEIRILRYAAGDASGKDVNAQPYVSARMQRPYMVDCKTYGRVINPPRSYQSEYRVLLTPHTRT